MGLLLLNYADLVLPNTWAGLMGRATRRRLPKESLMGLECKVGEQQKLELLVGPEDMRIYEAITEIWRGSNFGRNPIYNQTDMKFCGVPFTAYSRHVSVVLLIKLRYNTEPRIKQRNVGSTATHKIF
jgi:hypothetical protein